MTWVVRKYIAYLVFDNSEKDKEQGFTFAFEPFENKVAPAVFESQMSCDRPYRLAKELARSLNNKIITQDQ